ncbi:hypothetical protein BHE74_00036387, partial [Ensete ventricosum]
LSSVGHREQQAESRDENRRPRRRQQQLEMAEAITLSSGYRMPIIGLGVWRMESKSIRDLILSAISIGYRHFDCAGNAFSFSPHRRIPSYMYIGVGTTASALGEDGVLDIDTTISLETTWHAMEDLVSMGLVRSIGIR